MYRITVTYHLMDASWQDAEDVRLALRGLGFGSPTTRTTTGLVERIVTGEFDYPSATEARDSMRWKISNILSEFDLQGRALVSVAEHITPPPEIDTTMEYIAS